MKKSVAEIRAEEGGEARKIMIITHHPPFFRGAFECSERIGVPYESEYSLYGNDILGGYGFEGIGEGDLWAYGHTHYSTDVIVEDVRVYSNQRGSNSPPLIDSPRLHDFNINRTVEM